MAGTVNNWLCPFCGLYASSAEIFPIEGSLPKDSPRDQLKLTGNFTLCPNPKCRQATVIVVLRKGKFRAAQFGELEPRFDQTGTPRVWRLVPDSGAKVFPEYVPEVIRNDYVEACRIKDLSPKASATLARRTLQGMIRDFWGISKPRLAEEIATLKKEGNGDSDTWEAIDSVRKIGNIGAHMEKDINTIIDVDPEEADKLIWLIETLIKEWYITREERKRNLEELAAIGKSKKAAAKEPATE
jgi:hypothetical protein